MAYWEAEKSNRKSDKKIGVVIMAKCTFPKDINNCPFYDKEKMECNNNDNTCSFREVIEDTKYERKERWYEKYYKDSRPVK